jgi:hypothetical protein
MNNNIKNNADDQKIKELLSGTRLKAGDNLKYRIMQQIETEKALSRKAVGRSIPALRNILPVLVIMYILIAIVGIALYAMGGQSQLTSLSFYVPISLILFVGSLFWMVSCLDDSRRAKRNKTH